MGCANGAWRVFCTFLLWRTGLCALFSIPARKPFTPPWTSREKLEAYNKMVMEISGDESKKKNFKSFVDDVWKDCMDDKSKYLTVRLDDEMEEALEQRMDYLQQLWGSSPCYEIRCNRFIKYLCGNFEKRLSEIFGRITDFEIPLQIPHPRFSIIFRREISHFRSHHPTEKERFGKNRTSLHFRKNSVFTRVSYLPKYRSSRPFRARPWRASSRAIS